MKLACVVFVFSIFASTVLLAQSNSVPPIDRLLVPTSAAAEAPQTPVSSFTAPVVYNSGGEGAQRVAVADVNGDGKLDLVVTNECANSKSCASGSVSVLLGNGDGTFRAAVSYASGGSGTPNSVVVADVNGDGKPDLLVANTCDPNNNCSTGSVAVLRGKGDGTFQTAVNYYGSGGWGADSLVVADVNGDGKPDLVVMNLALCGPPPCGLGQVGVLLGNGDGTFQAARIYDSGAYWGYAVAVADVNGDGKPDLVVVSGSTTVCETCGVSTFGILLGNGDGTFKPVVTYDLFPDDGSQMSVAVADVNGDGKPDVMVASQCAPGSCSSNSAVSVLLGKGDGTFQSPAIYDSGGVSTTSVAVADVNRDGKPDLVVASNNPFSYFYCGSMCERGQAAVLLGNGDGTFQGPVTYDSDAYFSDAIAVADVNGDGKPDLVVVNLCAVSKNCNGAGFTNRGAVSVLISAPAATTSLASSRNPSIFGQSVTFTATVSSSLGTPTGKVTFQNGGGPLAIVSLSGGTARYTTSKLRSVLNVITALYGGDSKNGSSTSTPVNQIVYAKSVTTLTSSPNPSTYGEAVTFIATVTSNLGAPPDGEPITFMKGTTVLGTGALSGGSASLTTSTLPVGTSYVKAVYGGDSTFAGSKSTAVAQVVN